MLTPSDLGWDLARYAQVWLEERFRLTLGLAREVAKGPKQKPVHDIRVACRRLREAIAFFHGIAEVPPMPDVDRAARRMARAVGQLREVDVATKRLATLPVGRELAGTVVAREELGTRLRHKRTTLAKRKRERIVRRAHQLETALSHRLHLRSGPRRVDGDGAQEVVLKSFVDARVALRRDDVERLFAAVSRRHRTAKTAFNDDELHSLRIAVKRWRYALEIGRAVMPRVLYRPISLRLRHLQDLGGKNQDLSDLTKVVTKALSKRKKTTSGERALLAAVRAEQAKASAAFVEGLHEALGPPREVARAAVPKRSAAR
jgi:CHAD domain-containing protein